MAEKTPQKKSLAGRIKDFAFIRTSDTVKAEGARPESFVSGGPSLEMYGADSGKGRVKIEDLEYWIYKHPLVFASINFLWPMAILGKGYKVIKREGGEKEAKLCESIVRLSTFEPSLISVISHALGYGKGFQEIIWSPPFPKMVVNARGIQTDEKEKTTKKRQIMGFDIFHPKGVKPKWDDKGTITRYEQTVEGSTDPIPFKVEQIAYYKFFSIGDSVDGIGLVEPLVYDLWIERNVSESMGEAVWRFANAFFDVTKTGATDLEIKAMEDKFKDVNRRTFFAHSEKYKIEIVGAKNAMPDISPIIDYQLNKLCAGLRIPKPILLSAGEKINRATLEGLIEARRDEIMLLQSRVSRIVESQIFMRAIIAAGFDVKKTPDFAWNALSVKDEKERADVLLTSATAIEKLLATQIITKDEAKKFLKKQLELEAG